MINKGVNEVFVIKSRYWGGPTPILTGRGISVIIPLVIVGIGIDIVAVDRIQHLSHRWGNKFLRRIFTEEEIAYSFKKRAPYPHLAARFASKEALLKALGRGIFNGTILRQIEVVNNEAGIPYLNLYGNIKELVSAKGVSHIHISISHDGKYATAQVILEKT